MVCDICNCNRDNVIEFKNSDGTVLNVCDCCQYSVHFCKHCKKWKWASCDCYNFNYAKNSIDGEFVCDECLKDFKRRKRVFYCVHCKTFHFKEKKQALRVGARNYICDEYVYLCTKCDGCGQLVYSTTRRSFAGSNLCYACFAKKKKFLIKAYHDNPKLEFYRKDGDKNICSLYQPDNDDVYYGLELEVDSAGQRDDMSEETIKLLNEEVYCMRDGSLQNGFEIVTHPHTENALYNMNWENAFKFLVKSGYRSHDVHTCGLHLHVNRKVFAGKDIDCILRLINFMEVYKEDLITLSRRESRDLDHWAKFYNTKKFNDFSRYIKDINKSGYHNERYYALNITNSNTVEFRLMRGTLKMDTFLATIDLLITISKNCVNIEDNDMKLSNWLKGLKTETIEYLKERQIFNTDKVKLEDGKVEEGLGNIQDALNNMRSRINIDPFPFIDLTNYDEDYDEHNSEEDSLF